MKRRGSAVDSKGSNKHDEELIQDLSASLRSRRSELLEVNGIEEELWTECVQIARDQLITGGQLRNKGVLKMFCVLCNKGLKGLVILFLVLTCIGLFLYLCKPASFFLQRKLHSSVYPASRLARKGLLALHPYLKSLGIDLFSSCILRNPFVPDDEHCPTAQDIKEWQRNGNTVPKYIIDSVRKGEWWILRSALHIDKEVTVQYLNKFSVDNAGVLPHICDQIVGGDEGSMVTAFYSDIFNIQKMKEALKSPIPWSLSWVECPNKENPLTLRSIISAPSHLPPDVITSSMSLFSVSTEWCISHHYHGDLPSTLLSLVVLKGEVRVVPVRAEDCRGHSHELWEIPIFLTKGEAVLLDFRYWSYEVQTWSNYSVTITSSLLSTEDAS